MWRPSRYYWIENCKNPLKKVRISFPPYLSSSIDKREKEKVQTENNGFKTATTSPPKKSVPDNVVIRITNIFPRRITQIAFLTLGKIACFSLLTTHAKTKLQRNKCLGLHLFFSLIFWKNNSKSTKYNV